jgi:nucleotide-binding universal stress UspA family protein
MFPREKVPFAMKSILIPVEDHDSMPAALESARLIARACGSYMEGFAVRPSAPSYVTIEPVSGLAFPGAYEAGAAVQARDQFESFMQAHGVPQTKREQTSYSYGWQWDEAVDDTIIGNHGRVFDLIVLGRPGPEPQNPRMAPLETALFDSGRPVLIVPSTTPQTIARNILVAWNRSTEQARTNAFALPLLRLADNVTVLTVEGGTTTGPSGEEAALHLRRNGVKATSLTIDPGVRSGGEATGEITLEHAASLGCDLLVKCAYTQSRLRQMIFGGATRHILANATLPILMAH